MKKKIFVKNTDPNTLHVKVSRKDGMPQYVQLERMSVPKDYTWTLYLAFAMLVLAAIIMIL